MINVFVFELIKLIVLINLNYYANKEESYTVKTESRSTNFSRLNVSLLVVSSC